LYTTTNDFSKFQKKFFVRFWERKPSSLPFCNRPAAPEGDKYTDMDPCRPLIDDRVPHAIRRIS